MKPYPSLTRRVERQFRRLSLGLLCPLAMANVWAASGPIITGVSGVIPISDAATATVFPNANVSAGDTNVLTVFVNFGPASLGTLSPLPPGVSQVGTNYVIGPTNDTGATALLKTLVFTPVNNTIPVPNTSNVVFQVYATDANNISSSIRSDTVQITSVDDPPTLTASGVVHITDEQLASPFGNVTVTDPDNQGTQPQTITVTLSHANTGYLLVGGSGFSSNNLTYTLTSVAPSAVSNAINGLIFQPITNALPVDLYDTNVFTIIDSDGTYSVTNTSVSVVIYYTNHPPTLGGIPSAPVVVLTGHTPSPSPFATLTLRDVDRNDDTNDPNGQTLLWNVTLTGPSPLGQLTYSGSQVGTTYSGSNEPPFATAQLRNLNYLPPLQAISGTNMLQIAITANDQHTGFISNNINLELYSIISPPGLSGTQSGQIVDDNTTIAPFSQVTIQSHNGNPVTVLIQLRATNDIQGQFINLGSFARNTSVSPSIYYFSGTSESATAAIESLLFQPTPNRINGSSTDLATFGITLIDGSITNPVDYSTTVTIVPVNEPPTIYGISPLVTIQDSQTLTPFSTVLVTDPNENGQQTNSCTITLDSSIKGTFSTNSLMSSGFTNTGGGFVFIGSPAAITAAIRQLVFIPTPGLVPVGLTETTTFTIVLDDYHGGHVVNSGTAVRVASVSGMPVVDLPTPQPISLPSATNVFPFAEVSVSDPTLLQMSIHINNTSQGYFTTNSVNSNGFTNVGNGTYFISGYSTNITPDMQNLAFVPAANLPFGSVINFTINVTNALPNYVSVNHAIVLRTVRTSYIVTKLTDYNPTSNVASNLKLGTLRNAIANAKSGDHITFDIRSGVSIVPDYPALIRLVAPLVLNNDVTFDGPGADRLAISGDGDGNGTPDVELFAVNANVVMNRLAFTNGYASFAGGGFEVTGSLTLSYCWVAGCRADEWGGAVDVNGGALSVDHCLFSGNSTSSQLGQGGGAISLYSDQTCVISDTTFATNSQNAVSGLGGGAIYAETYDPGTEFYPFIVGCTFRDNFDAGGQGSSLRPNVDNTYFQIQNSILADGHGTNIEMDESGYVISLGGNISDDSTYLNFSAGGSPQDDYVFSPPLDQTNIPAASIFNPLASNGGPTPTYALFPGSPAVDNAVSNVETASWSVPFGTDQRGYFRTNAPDIGAFELNASQRVIIEEIGFNPAPPHTNDQFIEFFIPRDSAPVNLAGFQVVVDGTLRHTFPAQTPTMQPGQALVVFSPNAVNTNVPVFEQPATSNLSLSHDGSIITLLNTSNQIVFQADYVGSFTATDPNDYGFLGTANQSLVLSPQFQGVFLPYERVVAKDGGANTNGLSNPGYDDVGTPLSGANAPPIAFNDTAATDAHTAITNLPVLANDVDPDITDTIEVVGVGVTNSAAVGVTNLIGYSTLGALLTINNSPTTGASVIYDPTASAYLQSLPQGSNVVDTFQYTILDFSNGVPHLRGSTPQQIAQNTAKATATVTVAVVGVNSAPTPQNDSISTSPVLTTPANTLLTFTMATNILENDTDPNSDDNSNTLSIISISATNGFVPYVTNITTALGATVSLYIRFDRNQTYITYNPSGSAALYALNRGQALNDTFYYSVQDSHGAVGTAAISILVTGVADAPIANPATLATDENTPITVPVSYFLANDIDPNTGSTLHISAVTPFSSDGASVQLVGTNIIYDPTVSTNLEKLGQKEFTIDTFVYTLSDEWGLTSNAVVSVNVAGVNDPPVSRPDFYTTNENTLLTISAAQGVLANDYDPDTNDLIRVIPFTENTATNCDTSANGGAPVTMNADGSFTFDPRTYFDWVTQGQVVPDSFSYVVMDHSLSIANDDNFSVITGTSNNVLPVLANDAVLSGVGGAFSVIGVSTPNQGGTASINASNNAIIYTPAPGYVGPEMFSYTNSDGLGGGDYATVNITVVGSTLYALPDSFTVAEDTTNVLNVLLNDTLIPATGASISITSLGTPNQGGTVSLNGTGPNNAVNYTPNPSVPAPYNETFTYMVTSGSLTATGLVSVTVLNRSNALSLTANSDRFTVLAGSGNNPLDVLANDVILPGSVSNLFITGFTTTNLSGAVSINAAQNRLVYEPGAGITNQSESFTYYFADGAGGTGSASVLVQVTPGGFFANDDIFRVYENSSNTLPVMVNDVELPNLGQTLFISAVGTGTNAPSHGSVTVNGPGTALIYVPTPNYSGPDDFTYEISDGSPARAQGHVHVTVLNNSAVPSNPDDFRVARESANNVLAVLTNDYTLPMTTGPLTITGLLTNGVNATVSINGTGTNNTLLYTPNPGFIGTDYFSYVLTDSYGNQGTNLITVMVGSLAPLNDAFNVLSGSSSNYLDVRANDYSVPDTNALRPIYSLGTPDQGGSVTANTGGTAVLYTPAPGFAGVEHFSYQLKDDTTNLYGANVTVTVRGAGSDRSTNTVTISVVGVNDLPTITGTQNGFHITEEQTVQPFTNVIIGDLDECGYQTNTVTVLLDKAVKGLLTNLGGFVNIAPGVYQMQDAPPVITASLQQLVFVPTEDRIIVPTSEYTGFTIVANDGYGVLVTNNTTAVLVDSHSEQPVISGVQSGFAINDHQNVQPFTNVVISEVDDSSLESIIVSVSLDLAAKGVLQNLGGFTNSGPGAYTMQGTASNITASLKNLVFVPTIYRITVPLSEPTTFTIVANNTFTPPVTNSSTTVIVTAKNDPSTITGAQGGWAINDKQTVMPFTNIVIFDPDDLSLQPLTVTVALDTAAKGILQNLGGFTNSAPGAYTMHGTGSNITAAIQNLVFKPTENRIIVPNSEITTLTISVDDGFQYPLITNNLTTVNVTATNDPPTITGTATNNITDEQTCQPFASVVIADVDNLAAAPPQPQTLTVTINMDNLDKGSLHNLGGFSLVTPGVYQMVGIASAVTPAIQGIVFVPVVHHIVVPTTAPIHFMISANDGFVATPTTNLAVVNVTPVNDPPVISGTVAGQLVYDRLSLSPFAGVQITEVDDDRTQALRITITLDNPIKGVLSSLGGFTNMGGGVYTMGSSNGTTTAAMITTAIRGLVYSPTADGRVSFGSPETTRFTLRADNFFTPTVVDSNTTVIAMDALTAQTVAADRAVNAQFGWSVATLRDTAVIGAPFGSTTNPGAAYIFVRSQDGSNNWTQLKKLMAPDGTGSDLFGTSVSISGGIIVVGASASKGGGGGGAYVFYQNQGGANNWGFIKRLAASDDVPNNSFGAAVLVSNTLVVVGAPQALTSSNGSAGAIYLYQKDMNGSDQWGFVKKTSRSGSPASDRFGSALSLSGDTLAVGTPLSTNGFNATAGAVFMFDRNTGGAGNWGQTTRIVSTNTSGSDHFGNSVSISGDNLAVGAPQFSLGSTSFVGSAYIFNRNQGGAGQWGAIKRIVLTNAAASDYLGTAVALDGNSLVVTAPQTGISNGVTYLYQQNMGGSNQWGQLDRFEPAAVGPLDAFGSAASIFNNTIVIGAYNGLYNGQRSGDVYMFRIFYGNPPEWLIQMANQYLQVGTPFAFSVPAGALVDPDINDVLAYSLGSSPAVPSWLNFDPVAGNFSGTPTAAGVYTINLLATDIYGLTSTNQFLITVSLAGQSNFNILSASVAPAARNIVNFQLSGVPNQAYRLQMATNLISPTWINVYTQAADINGNIQVNVTNPPAPSYYRTIYP